MNTSNLWPELPVAEWKDTYETLHMWTQIVGKIRLTLTPFQNHWWNCTLYLTPRGLTTSAIPYKGRHFRIDFDFISHILVIETADGSSKTIALRPRSVADFYQKTMAALGSLGMPVTIWTTPVEVPDRTPFEKDEKHAAYDPEYAQRVWCILVQASRVLTDFRSRFIGKVSPVHFFWGAFDLAVTRFSGRRAPSHPGAPNCARFVMVEAYSHGVVAVSGLAAARLVSQLFTPMPILNLKASRTTPSSPKRHSMISRWESSCFLTTWSVTQTHRMMSYFPSCRAPMKQPQRVPTGIDAHWSVSK
jgi:Family of unknown function (DUF5996)